MTLLLFVDLPYSWDGWWQILPRNPPRNMRTEWGALGHSGLMSPLSRQLSFDEETVPPSAIRAYKRVCLYLRTTSFDVLNAVIRLYRIFSVLSQ